MSSFRALSRYSLFTFAVVALGGCDGEVGPEPECVVETASWEPGDATFREATEEWGLLDLGVRALRVSLLDVDGDGWTDLLLRKGGGPDDFAVDGQRRRWLLRNTGEGTFEDITEHSRIFASRLDGSPGGRVVEVMISADIDNDGDVDVFTARTVSSPDDPDQDFSEVMINDGTGVFDFGPETADVRSDYTASPGARPSVPVGAAFTDVDRDGNVDIWVSNNKRGGDDSALQDRLFLGTGTGDFIDATEDLGLTTQQWREIEPRNEALTHTWGWGATSCDLDDDGLPELMSASYGRGANHLWQSEGVLGGMGYRNQSVDSGYAYDHRDDWTTNINAQCYCRDFPEADECDLAPERDPNDSICTSLRKTFGPNYRWAHGIDREAWRLGGNSATTTCADLDNDGRFDLLTGEIVHFDVGDTSDPAEILFNETAGPGEPVRFVRPSNEEIGLVRDREGAGWYDDGDMNNAILDFDNDGYKDVYISSSDYPGTRGWLFHNLGGRRFEAMDYDEAIDHRRSAGVASVDLDRDGDLDLVVATSRSRCGNATDCHEFERVRIFENLADERAANQWLQVRLFGTGGSNAMAVGAKVTVSRCGESLVGQVDGGHGHQGTQEDRVLHFGLGIVGDTVAVTVAWPDAEGTVEEFTLEPDAMYDIVQGDGATVWSP
jgi:hypothetical protein